MKRASHLTLALLLVVGQVSVLADTEAPEPGATAAPGNGSAPDLRARAQYSEAVLGYARETLSNNPNDWTDARLELGRKFAPRELIIGRAVASQRFGLHDDTLGVIGYHPLGERTTGYMELTYSDTHRVLAHDTLHLQLAQSLADGWGVMGGLRHLNYNTTVVNVADLTLERYFSDYRAALTAYPSRSQVAGSASSYRLQFSRYYGDENNIQLALVRGTEVDKPTGVDSVLATSVRSVALFGKHFLTLNVGVDYAVGRTVQGATTRRAASIGLRYRFF